VITTGDPAESATADELLARARAGDTQAFCALASRHESRLLQQACGLCRDQSAAEDLASEALVEAWRSLARFDGSCRFSTWLFSILLHRYQKDLRRAHSRPVSLAQLNVAELEERQLMHENIPAAGPSPADAASYRERAECLRTAVESLSEKHRQVVLLRFFEEASLPEIATVLGCSIGTVKSRLHYALEKLREMENKLNLSDLREDK
jgi:RNA polymerase sigma-70 factor (ECF subfamily)